MEIMSNRIQNFDLLQNVNLSKQFAYAVIKDKKTRQAPREKIIKTYLMDTEQDLSSLSLIRLDAVRITVSIEQHCQVIG